MTSIRTRGDLAVSSGLHLGDGLFETVLLRGGVPDGLDAHLARMRRSGAALGVDVPADLDAFVAAHVADLWREEGGPRRAALRITVARGAWAGLESAPGDAAPVALLVRALPDAAPGPRAAALLDAPRIDPACPLAGHKVLSWMDRVEARRRARVAGADVALLVTVDGDLACADAANVLVVRAGAVWTPPLSRGVLPGVTRARALEALRRDGRAVREEPVDVAALDDADEVLLTSSLDGVLPVRRLLGCAGPAPREFGGAGPVGAWLARCVVASGDPSPPRGG